MGAVESFLSAKIQIPSRQEDGVHDAKNLRSGFAQGLDFDLPLLEKG